MMRYLTVMNLNIEKINYRAKNCLKNQRILMRVMIWKKKVFMLFRKMIIHRNRL